MPAPRQTVSLVVGGVLLAAGLGLGATGATAVGTLPTAGKSLTVAPAQGNDNIRPTLTTSAACPATTAFYFASLYGPGLPDDGQPMLTQPLDTVEVKTGPFTIQTSFTFKETAAAAGKALTAGTYAIRLVCLDELSNVKDAFSRQIVFSSDTAWTVSGATPTPTATSTATATPTVSSSASATPTATTTPTPSATAVATPTPTTTGPAVVAVDATGATLGSSPTLRIGDVVALTVRGFVPGEQVGVVLEPQGTDLGGDDADAAGVFEGQYEVPNLEPGNHTLAFNGSSRIVRWTFRVAGQQGVAAGGGTTTSSGGVASAGGGTTSVSGGSGGLAATGAGVSTQLLLAGLLVATGLGVTWCGLPRGRHERRRFAAA